MSVYRTSMILFALAIAGCDGEMPEQDAAVEPDAAEPECDRDGHCDDGLYCNGVEVCVGGACGPGTPPDCDDGDACTEDACSEEEDACAHPVLDADLDGEPSLACGGADCDDADATRFSGNPEICDELGADEDCDPETVGDRDLDADGSIDARCCNGEACGVDCDDVRASVKPGAVEACDGVDNDCDTIVDEDVAVEGFVDADGDLHGDPTRPISSCAGVPGFSSLDDDCADDDPSRHGAQAEVCDEVDNDCDGEIDEDAREVSWFVDDDGDGFGDPTADVVESCTPIPSRSLIGTDCDDGAADIHPAAAERCDGIDDNCNGVADYRIRAGDFEDDDGDGLLDAQCEGGRDCDDRNPEVAGGFAEICDGRDNDCDAEIDEETSSALWFADLDGDGYGSTSSGAVASCTAVAGHSLRGGDCDDRNMARRPYALEMCDGLDDDCDATIDEGLTRECGSPLGICTLGRQACTTGIWSRCTGTEPRVETCNGLDDDCDGADDDGLSCP